MTPPASGSAPWNPWIRRGILSLSLYACLCLGIGCAQRRLIYHPPPPTSSSAAAAVAEGFEPWLNRSGQPIGWRMGGRVPSRGCVLVFHGNAGSAAHRAYLARPIHEATGLDVHVLEYPGYDGRPGDPSESTLTAAALEGLDAVQGRGPVYLVGESLGTGVAAFIAGKRPADIAGVVLLAPFTSLVAAARAHFPWLPVSWMLLDRYPSDRWLEGYRGPVAVVVGERDEVVPAALGRALHAGYAGPKRLWEMAGEGHNDVPDRPREWWEEAFEFLRKSAGHP
jgi:hypothetical protein